MMRRIMIIGPSGSGKSTLARMLGDSLDIPYYYLDQLNFDEGWHLASKDEFQKAYNNILSEDRWIIDGNYRGMDIEKRMDLADTLIYLDFSTVSSLINVVKRRIQYNKQTRPSLPKGCNEKIDLEFLLWVLNTRKRRPSYLKIAERMKDMNKTVLIFKNRRSVNQYLSKKAQ